MEHDKKSLNIRVSNELHSKFKYVSAYEGRSMSAQIAWLINKCVRDFEKENGPIDPPKGETWESWKY